MTSSKQEVSKRAFLSHNIFKDLKPFSRMAFSLPKKRPPKKVASTEFNDAN
jgi:hypothetical protein